MAICPDSIYRMEGNFGGGKHWRMTMNSPNLSHPNFLRKSHVIKFISFALFFEIRHVGYCTLDEPPRLMSMVQIIAEHDHQLARGLSPYLPPQPAACGSKVFPTSRSQISY